MNPFHPYQVRHNHIGPHPIQPRHYVSLLSFPGRNSLSLQRGVYHPVHTLSTQTIPHNSSMSSAAIIHSSIPNQTPSQIKPTSPDTKRPRINGNRGNQSSIQTYAQALTQSGVTDRKSDPSQEVHSSESERISIKNLILP